MFPLEFGETVTRQRAARVTDRFSNQAVALDWSTTTTLDIPGCAFAPGSSTEPLEQARTAVITTPTVYAPSGSDVLAGDRLVVRGRTWDVKGDPADFTNPFSGWEAGMVIELGAVSG